MMCGCVVDMRGCGGGRDEHKIGCRCPVLRRVLTETPVLPSPTRVRVSWKTPRLTRHSRLGGLHAMLSHDYLLPWWSVHVTKLAAAATCLLHSFFHPVSYSKPPHDHHNCGHFI
ncbi:hypothetical protein E2C01_094927 [Portunus trituberculatus]|uniref:Uncharacterized protein n=1 Tax=Portunus trituberculatus TaxID=210409 RepID=A0A5B7K2Z3_PORTR|nr:hypothetical protein [Portunus trituberculatus]